MIPEYDALTNKLTDILPFEATPTRELVNDLRKNKKITLSSKLTITSVFNTNELGGIICATSIDGNALACSLTHLIIPPSNPLYKEITKYQTKRAKMLQKQNGWQ